MGRLTKLSDTNPATLAYDQLNRLTQYTSGGAAMSFQYDVLGNRIAKTANSVITKYIGGLVETDAGGTIKAYYVYGLGLISKIEGSGAYFYQYDGLGSTVAITDSTGAIRNKYAYNDFGQVATNATETVANPFKYVGKYGVQTDTPDLLYMRARYYMPGIGRFVNKDPIGLAGGMNRYLYVLNNPIGYIDPSGLRTIGIGITINGNGGLFSGTFSGGIVIDDAGNIGIIYYYGGGVGIGAGFSGGISFSGSNADTICDLEGPFAQSSVGVGFGPNVSGDIFIGPDSYGNTVVGGGVTIGTGVGAGSSSGITWTKVRPVGRIRL